MSLLISSLVLLTGVILTSGAENERKSIPMFQPLSDEMIWYINHKANTTWKAGRNGRFTQPYEVKKMLGTIPDPNGFRLPLMCVLGSDSYDPLPKEFDAATKWPHCSSIVEIRDQSSCGSCWAFGAVEAMSDRICIASQGKHTPVLSAENMVDCCTSCGMGCNGGFPPKAWEYWKKQGVVTGGLFESNVGCQPYSFPPCEHHVIGPRPPCNQDVTTPACKHTCRPGYNMTYQKDKWYARTVYKVPADEHRIMRELLTNGPMEVSFEVYGDFPSYKSGVYQHVSGGLLGGHAVRLVGWGEDDGVPYWRIANSWNTDWGDGGYFKILRGKNECGIESDVNAGLPKLPQ
uniref:Cathepsin B-like cysteine proteinase n=2 Tax=Fasciola TaxID=6191 RepID=A0A5B8ZUB3_FASGI|nr:cathepsin B [Fasciola gigantica]